MAAIIVGCNDNSEVSFAFDNGYTVHVYPDKSNQFSSVVIIRESMPNTKRYVPMYRKVVFEEDGTLYAGCLTTEGVLDLLNEVKELTKVSVANKVAMAFEEVHNSLHEFSNHEDVIEQIALMTKEFN